MAGDSNRAYGMEDVSGYHGPPTSEEKVREVYKVVRSRATGHGYQHPYTSCTQHHPAIWTGYRINRKTFPKVKGTPLIAFATLENALDWTLSWEGEDRDLLRIFRCEAAVWEGWIPDAYLPSSVQVASTLREYWQTGQGQDWRNGVGYPTWGIPEGTVFCKWIKLVEQSSVKK